MTLLIIIIICNLKNLPVFLDILSNKILTIIILALLKIYKRIDHILEMLTRKILILLFLLFHSFAIVDRTYYIYLGLEISASAE